MNPPGKGKGWGLLTPERMGWDRWTRKRRLKFMKRWRRQHNGQRFRFMILEYVFQPLDVDPDKEYQVIFFKREPNEELQPGRTG